MIKIFNSLMMAFILMLTCNNAYADLEVDLDGNSFLSQCLTNKDIRDKVQNQIKNNNSDDRILLNEVACNAAAITAFRTVIEIGFVWLDVDTDCYRKWYDMNNFSVSQITDTFLKYLQNTSEERHLSVGMLMAGMLHEYYPVPKECKLAIKLPDKTKT